MQQKSICEKREAAGGNPDGRITKYVKSDSKLDSVQVLDVQRYLAVVPVLPNQ